MALADDPAALVERIAEKLLAGQISATLRAQAEQQVARVPPSNAPVRVAEALWLISTSPEFAIHVEPLRRSLYESHYSSPLSPGRRGRRRWPMPSARTPGVTYAQMTGGGSFADYKALVCVFLFGGNDSWNMVVPSSNAEYSEYAELAPESRGPAGLASPAAAGRSRRERLVCSD